MCTDIGLNSATWVCLDYSDSWYKFWKNAYWFNYFSPSFSPLVIYLQNFIGAIVSHVTLKYYGEKKQNSSQFRHFCFFEKCWTLLPNLIEPLVKIVISWKMNKTRTRMLLIIRDYVNEKNWIMEIKILITIWAKDVEQFQIVYI